MVDPVDEFTVQQLAESRDDGEMGHGDEAAAVEGFRGFQKGLREFFGYFIIS